MTDTIFLNAHSQNILKPYLANLAEIAADDKPVEWLDRTLLTHKVKLAVAYAPASISEVRQEGELALEQLITIDLWACKNVFHLRSLEISAVILHECGHLLNPPSVADANILSSAQRLEQAEFMADEFVLKFPRMRHHLLLSLQKLLAQQTLFDAGTLNLLQKRFDKLDAVDE